MGANSAIAWTHHTYNYWRGCTKVGPGCDFCYAEARDIQYESGVGATSGKHWGAGAPRILATPHTRNAPFRWERDIEKTGKYLVFASSLADVFDNEIDPEWRAGLWDVIRKTKRLRYQIVTKRVINADKMLPADFEENFKHVGIISTVVTQNEANRDVPRLLRLKRERKITWVGLSVEPQLEHISLHQWCSFPAPYLDWVITGGESLQPLHRGHQPRPYDIDWTRSLIQQTRGSPTRLFVKQLGSNPYSDGRPMHSKAHGAETDPERWPPELRVQEFPQALCI